MGAMGNRNWEAADAAKCSVTLSGAAIQNSNSIDLTFTPSADGDVSFTYLCLIGEASDGDSEKAAAQKFYPGTFTLTVPTTGETPAPAPAKESPAPAKATTVVPGGDDSFASKAVLGVSAMLMAAVAFI